MNTAQKRVLGELRKEANILRELEVSVDMYYEDGNASARQFNDYFRETVDRIRGYAQTAMDLGLGHLKTVQKMQRKSEAYAAGAKIGEVSS